MISKTHQAPLVSAIIPVYNQERFLSDAIESVQKQSYTPIELLVIDDFAFKKIDQKSAEYFYAVVDERYRQKSIILTSNRAINDWANIFPDPVMANAIMDRLAHNAHQIIIKGESYRKKYRPKLKNA